MELKNVFVQDTQGNIIPGATCYLYERNTSVLITGVVDKNGASLRNPFTTDSNGLAQFAAPNGVYDLRVATAERDYRLPLSCFDVADGIAAVTALVGQAQSAADAAANSAEEATIPAQALRLDLLDNSDSSKGSKLIGYDGIAAQDIFDQARPLADYTALRAYTGRAKTVRLTTPGVEGPFRRLAAGSYTDDNGTLIVATNGVAWKRPDVRVLKPSWFGAPEDGVNDDYPGIQAAVNALPLTGGCIDLSGPNYKLSAVPAEGAKSIMWNIGAGTKLSGVGVGEGKFGYMLSNPAQLAVGPYIRSHSSEHSTNSNGGIAAYNVEMIQPADYIGQSVAAYFGAIGSSPNAGANVWAVNGLVRAEAGAKGTYQCFEIDVDNFSTDALVKGISISGAGTVGPRVALEIVRANNTPWAYGIDILNSVVGLRVRASTQTRMGLLVGAPATQTGAILSGKQLANGDDGVLLERFTDTAPTGNLLRMVNAANNTNLFSVAASGSVNSVGSITAGVNLTSTTGNITAAAGYVRGSVLEATGPVSASAAGSFRLSASTATTVGGAGGAAALPATPVKYLIVNQDGVNYKMPLYATS